MTGRQIWKYDLYEKHVYHQSPSLHSMCNANGCSQKPYSINTARQSSSRFYPVRNSATAFSLITRIPTSMLHKDSVPRRQKSDAFKPQHLHRYHETASNQPPQATNHAPTNSTSTTPSSRPTYHLRNLSPLRNQHPPLIPSSSVPASITISSVSHLLGSPANSMSVLFGKAGWPFSFLRICQGQAKVY